MAKKRESKRPDDKKSGAKRAKSGTTGSIEIRTEEEIARLPRWARVAFAARCARRVQPLFVHFWPKQREKHRAVLADALSQIEAAASSIDARRRGIHAELGSRVHTIVREVANHADFILKYDTSHGRSIAYSATVAASAYHALKGGSARDAFLASKDAQVAAMGISNAASDAVAKSVRRDSELLRLAAEREKWTDATPVAPEFFGPMWPDGVPEGWPVDVAARDAAPPVMKIEIVVPAGMNEAESKAFNERVAKFYAALSGLHASMGGTGLRILDEDSCSTAPAEMEAPHETDGVETPNAGREIGTARGTLVGIGGAR